MPMRSRKEGRARIDMSITRGLMSSNTDMWATPQAFFDKMNKEFHFNLDVCATKENAKCARFYTAADDGLSKDSNS